MADIFLTVINQVKLPPFNLAVHFYKVCNVGTLHQSL
jgi:hypothetical protein